MTDEQDIAEIKRAKASWEANTLQKTLDKHPERRAEFVTASGHVVERLYTPLDARPDYPHDLGFPGEYPFTRGVQPTMYRGRLWTMRQYAGFASAVESNSRYKYLLAQGQTGLSVAFDLPTQMGYDSDHPMASGEVGKVGVIIDSLKDMETLFADIPLDKISTSMTINSTAAILLAMYIAVAERQGLGPKVLRGTTQNDILKEYIARGTYIFPPAPSMRLTTDIIGYCTEHMPKWNPISISGYHIREAGSTAAQEVAFTLANAIAYVEAVLDMGLDIDRFAPRLAFFFGSHNDLFEEAAKFRAARRMWSELMRERFDAKDARSLRLRFHTQTAGCTLTAQQSELNVARVTLQALAAVLGGTQSLHTNSMDEAFALPSENAVRLALRTQQIIAHESGVANTIDPLGGSYYVECLTSQIEQVAKDYIAKIEGKGGVLACIENGYIQNEILESAYRYQREIESGERTIVGVNEFVIEEPITMDILRVDAEVEAQQKTRLVELRASRDDATVEAALERLHTKAGTKANLMPILVEAVKCYATLGEICDVLRTVFGEHRPQVML